MHKISDDNHSIEMREGVPELSFFFSDAGPLPQQFYAFIDELLNEQHYGECVLEVAAPLSNVVDGYIDNNRYTAHSDRVVFSSEQRDDVAAIRAALMAAVSKLDAIDYIDETKSQPEF